MPVFHVGIPLETPSAFLKLNIIQCSLLPSTWRPFYFRIWIYLSTYLSIYPPIHPSYLSIHPSIISIHTNIYVLIVTSYTRYRFYHVNHLKEYKALASSAFSILCKHPLCLVLELLHYPKMRPCTY